MHVAILLDQMYYHIYINSEVQKQKNVDDELKDGKIIGKPAAKNNSEIPDTHSFSTDKKENIVPITYHGYISFIHPITTDSSKKFPSLCPKE